MTKFTTIGFLFSVFIVLTGCKFDNQKKELFDRQEEFSKILKTHNKIHLNTSVVYYPKTYCNSCQNKTMKFILKNPRCIIIHELKHNEKCNLSLRKNCIHLSKYQIDSVYGLYFLSSVTMELSNGELSKFRII
jgi:hypothetical protein